jgi:D-alanyl-D-alanine carboxypeptidase (penicillin-binding protein 5/6)
MNRNFFATLVLSACVSLAHAQTPVPNKPAPNAGPRPVPAAPQLGAKSYLLMDFNSERILVEKNPDMAIEPASITKLMTSYVVFKELAEGNITLEEMAPVSEKAWRTGGSRMFIEPDMQVSVEDLVKGMVIQSGNDASVALAENVAGSEAVFAELMNQHAQSLGMLSSNFKNSTGLPHDDHYSSARDLATLAQAVIHEFPEYYKWYSIKEFTYNDIKQPNRNNLLWRDDSVDGMKTGHTDDAGYCLVASATRDGMRIISVVMGTASAKSRIDGSQTLINYGFRFFETRLLFQGGVEITSARIWKSANETSSLGLLEDLRMTIPRGSYDDLESTLNVPSVLLAPVAEGQPLAELKVSLNGDELVSEPLRALGDNPNGSIWQRTRDSVILWFE